MIIQRLILLIMLFYTVVSCTTYYKGPVSDHFDGTRFFNPNTENHNKTLWDIFKWRFFGESADWPEEIPVAQSKNFRNLVSANELEVTFVNHSTLLVQMDGLNILTDPIWSVRTSPVTWAGPKRVRKPGVRFEDLPKIHVVIISHNHYDHMDLPTLKKLKDKFDPVFLVGLGNSYHLDFLDPQKIRELDWNEHYKIKDVEFIFTQVKHWSKRWLWDTNKALWGGFVIKSPSSRVYFGGDSGYDIHYKQAGEKFGPFDVALIPFGAYLPRWFMKNSHMNPAESAQAHLDLNSKKTIGIHFGTFQLTDEGVDDPIIELNKALKDLNISISDYLIPENGQTFKIK